ncbi:MAG: type IX secretion system membrane protein PorP/SprF [Bacteroidetes bacterium]|nr:type IX secretion system membrane protein PorP/SprF [Bacteroidota bacterium]HET6245982.1 type IX secretion system membrane protein PorP/SprF [Bacteroidia bacterium]
MTYKIIRLFLLLCIGVGWGNSAKAQDPQFSQFYANPLYLNPAFAGTGKCPRINLNYRNQWPGLSGTFITSSASYDQHVDALSGGIGLIVVNDNAGDGTLNTTNVSAIYSYQLPVTRTLSIKAGFQGTYLQKRIDWSKLTFGDMIDARRGFIYETNQTPINQGINTLDFSAGVLAFSKTYYVGMAAHHLTEPNESLTNRESPLPRKLTFHGGVVIPAGSPSEEVNISPNILYMIQQNFQQMLLGLYATKGPMVGGIWYRHTPRNPDAMIVLLGIEQGIFKFGYSYDVTVSKLGVKTWGAHEFSLGMQFYCKPKKKKFRTISCPSF